MAMGVSPCSPSLWKLRGRPDVVPYYARELRRLCPPGGHALAAYGHAGAAKSDGRVLQSRLREAAESVGAAGFKPASWPW
jgi:hypothetical protein